jgi:DNA-binding beta-propeller fold protein YncE
VRHHRSWNVLAVLPIVIAACGWGGLRERPVAEEPPRLVWPEPPDRARIEWVSIFASAADLGITRSVWARVASLVTGGGEMRMVRPAGVAAAAGIVAVADPGARLVHVFDLNRRRARALDACGATRLSEPVAVALLGQRLYVSDATAARIQVFDLDGECAGGWALESGSRPAGLAADAQRMRLYVADVGAHQILGFDPQGHAVLRFGSRGSGPGQFNYPTWVALDATGNLYVTDTLNFRVQVFDPDGRTLGAFGRQGDGSGELARPKGIGVDREGHLYLVDALFDAVQLFDREGRYLMVLGRRGHAAGQFWLPSGLAIDGDRIYVADSYNRRVQVFRFLGGDS